MNDPVKVLVVDDDAMIHKILRPYLIDEGFVTLEASNGPDAMSIIDEQRPDVILLDRKLPGLRGHEVLAEIRRRKIDAFVIFLTASGEEVDRVLGLELGADDYITKPFSARETVSRVKAVLRRRQTAVVAPGAASDRPEKKPIVVGDLRLDTAGRSVTIRGSEVMLTPTEFRILEVLASEPGRVFSRAQLLDAVLRDSLDVLERSLDSHIAHLRQKIEPGSKPCYILTVYGFGYKFRSPEKASPAVRTVQRAVDPQVQ